MLTKLNNFIINCSTSWWKFLLLIAGQASTMGIMMGWINQKFPAASGGNLPFDMQNNLTVNQIFSQLENYTDKAFELYTVFQITDYFFPLFAGLVLATICAFSLRHTSESLYQIAKNRNLFLLLLIPSLFDWAENLNLLCVIISWPNKIELSAQLAVLAKQGKLAFMNVSFALTGILFITGLFGWIKSKVRPRRTG
ncbi:MAG: hypothetical protein GY746_07325 [Gammaproteobacteria bacterium]|nr:hypothetical protein [Gammaproteobacteria bacterium]MCP4832479.1 hypothetical protein [Gammaproteobacteria bacterium]